MLKRVVSNRKRICDPCIEKIENDLNEIKSLLTLKNKELKYILDAMNDPSCKCPCESPSPEPEPDPTEDRLYGFAYSDADSSVSGNVKFQVFSPRHEDIINKDGGLQVSKTGVYQVSYSVSCKVLNGAANPVKFKIVVNDSFIPSTSVLETNTSQHLFSSQLVPLMEGDIVKLDAEVSEGNSYSKPTLQILMI